MDVFFFFMAGLTTCQQRYEESFLFPPLGRFVPQCKEGGNFDEIQCHSSTGHCWCVDSYGFEQLGTRIRGRPNCTTPGEKRLLNSGLAVELVRSERIPQENMYVENFSWL